ncbi:MAG: TRAP transporter small permease [Bacillota bacterium]
MRGFSETIERIAKALTAVATPLMFLIFALLSVQVILRYVFHTGLWWVEEAVTLLVVYLTFIGTPACLARGQHPSMDLIFLKFPRKVKGLIRWCFIFVVLVDAFCLVVEGWKETMLQRNLRTVTLGVSRAIFYFPMVLGGILLLMVALLGGIEAVVDKTPPPFLKSEAMQTVLQGTDEDRLK